MFLHTYTFTIHIVSLVSEKYYFAGLIIGYKGIIVKNAFGQSVKLIRSKEKDERLTSPKNLGQPPTEEQPRTSP